ncbi:hypothetical protein [Enterovirga aerilata]|uniref:Uncharacterized protein n=1 Tax=Enterovirga aerilata TaxID=2730920 RepID=A0A849IF02_9HYPH|nr:hypothetical protein [Enterovirga sp. DB1703]NNM72463.1 hypothetical protein [Enterovirga sp. DB1703]
MHDTQLMLAFADENMMDKMLATGVRVYVPEMSGYSDEFDRMINKDDMMSVPPDDVIDPLTGELTMPGMKNYGGGDVDATYRLAKALDPILRRDQKQYQCYRKIQFPALLTFARVAERYGIMIDQDHLDALGVEIAR